ncbi:hypothetical protein ACFQHO_43630 [Actinomadura yumaensis]|uniref:hypothetical protein n=1 Tax=Actinomadura yumaensis TaxID=111807 RepID=UPI0036207B54
MTVAVIITTPRAARPWPGGPERTGWTTRDALPRRVGGHRIRHRAARTPTLRRSSGIPNTSKINI